MSSEIHIIRSEADYETAMSEYESYFANEPSRGTRAADRFELLGLLLAKYEEGTAPVRADPVVVLAVMEGRGHSRRELAVVLGGAPRVTEFLGRKRELSINQIRKLHSDWHIPTNALIGLATA